MTHRWVGMLMKRFLKIVVPMLPPGLPSGRGGPARLVRLDRLQAVFPGNRKKAYLRAPSDRGPRGASMSKAGTTTPSPGGLATGLINWRCRDRLLDGLTEDDAALARASRSKVASTSKPGLRPFQAGGDPPGQPLRLATSTRLALAVSASSYPLRLFMERPRNVSKFLSEPAPDTTGPLGQEKLFISRRSTATEAAGSILRAMRILNAGMVLQIANDVRWQGAHTAPGHFLGSTYLFSTTWVVLAAMTGAPVVQTFCRPDGRGRYILEFLPSFRVSSDAPRNGQAASYVQRGLDAVADQVRQHPDQSNDYFTWPKPEIGLTKVA